MVHSWYIYIQDGHRQFFEIGITGDKTFIGLENYIHAFTAGGFLKQLKNTLIYIIVAVGIETVMGLIICTVFWIGL